MAKKLALVVHGIGEQKPGETLDALVGALSGDKACTVQSEERLLRETDFDLAEGAIERDVGMFNCQMRRVDVGADQVVFAEVFWGDISRGANNRVAGLIDLFRLVMGLGHLVRENAADIYPNGHILRQIANGFVYLLHGPITVINLTLGLGMGLLYVIGYLLNDSQWAAYVPSVAVLATAVVLAWVRIFLRKETQSYLFQVFWLWITFIAGFLVLLVLVTPMLAAVLVGQNLSLVEQLFLVQCSCENFLREGAAAWYTGVLLALVNGFWAVCICMVAGLGITQFIFDWRQKERAKKALFPTVCGAMLILWMFLSLVLWVTGAWFLNRSLGQEQLMQLNRSLEQGVGLIFWIWGAFFTLVGASIVTWAKRGSWLRRHREELYRGKTGPRLIIHGRIRIGTTLGVAILGLGALWTGAAMYSPLLPDFVGSWIGAVRITIEQFRVLLSEGLGLSSPSQNLFQNPTQPDTDGTFNIASYMTVAVGVLFYMAQDKLSIGIGIAKDVVEYFVHRYGEDKTGPNEYPSRARVQDRFTKVYKLLLASEQPDEVVVISHSQGTVIALEALRDGRMQRQCGASYKAPVLLTMGSPTGHIYGYYFANRFGFEEGMQKGIGRWINVYRIDDFVGTTVNTGLADWPLNIPVMPKGHTGYWQDEAVLPHLRAHVLQEFG